MNQELDEIKPVDFKAFRSQYTLVHNNRSVVFSLHNILDEETGVKYSGDFEIKLFLSLKERGIVAANAGRRNIGIDPFEEVFTLNKVVCELQAKCTLCPDWFKDDKAFEIVGIQPIDRIFTLVKAAQEEYKEMMNGR